MSLQTGITHLASPVSHTSPGPGPPATCPGAPAPGGPSRPAPWHCQRVRHRKRARTHARRCVSCLVDHARVAGDGCTSRGVLRRPRRVAAWHRAVPGGGTGGCSPHHLRGCAAGCTGGRRRQARLRKGRPCPCGQRRPCRQAHGLGRHHHGRRRHDRTICRTSSSIGGGQRAGASRWNCSKATCPSWTCLEPSNAASRSAARPAALPHSPSSQSWADLMRTPMGLSACALACAATTRRRRFDQLRLRVPRVLLRCRQLGRRARELVLEVLRLATPLRCPCASGRSWHCTPTVAATR